MKCPTDSFSLLDTQGDGFQPASFVREFGPYSWTHIAGYRELLHLLVLVEKLPNERAGRDYVIGQRRRAAAAIPEGWRARLRDGLWSNCSAEQIEKACDGLPLCFDKACQAVKALQIAFASARASELQTLDIYGFIHLRPAIYVLNGLNHKGSALLKKTRLTDDEKKIFDGLVQKLCPRDGRDEELDRRSKCEAFLYYSADGHSMTLNSAVIIQKHLVEAEMVFPHISMLRNRIDDGRMKKRKDDSFFESVLISLRGEQIDVLKKISVAMRA